VKGYTLITSWHRDGQRTHHVELWAQPTGRYLVARVYHWYEMWICRSWLTRPMERVYDWRHRHADVLSYLPLPAAQSVRSYELGERGRRRLARLDLPAATYAAIKQGGDSDGGPYGGDE
jgi:hypothetical protein